MLLLPALAALPPPLLEVNGPPLLFRIVQHLADAAQRVDVWALAVARGVLLRPPEVGQILLRVAVQKVEVLG